MKTYIELKTGQLTLPGIITKNQSCERCYGDGVVGHRLGLINKYEKLLYSMSCIICHGTGFKYEEVEYANA